MATSFGDTHKVALGPPFSYLKSHITFSNIPRVNPKPRLLDLGGDYLLIKIRYMLRHYLTIVTRNMTKYKGYTAINLMGLSLGFVCVLLIGFYVVHELCYDEFYPDADRIYRIYTINQTSQGMEHWATTPNALGAILQTEYPHFGDIVRLFTMNLLLSVKSNIFQHNVVFADQNMFQVFPLPFLDGDKNKVLKTESGIVITQGLAQKFFGNSDPMGKTITINGTQDFIISGVLESLRSTSSLKFDAVLPISRLKVFIEENETQAWWAQGTQTYIRFHKYILPEQLEPVLPNIIDRYAPTFMQDRLALGLQRLRDIHLDPTKKGNMTPSVSRFHLNLLVVVASFILLIAGFNYVNLSLALYSRRLREIGLRKVLGAYPGQLIWQFLGESIFLCCLSLIWALACIELILPKFNIFIGITMSLHNISIVIWGGGLGILVLLMGTLSGLYPAISLSKWQPATVVKGLTQIPQGKKSLRIILVTLQFVIAVVLIVCGLTISRQIHYIRNFDLGFNSEGLIVIPVHEVDLPDVSTQIRSFIEATKVRLGLIGINSINSISISEHVPGVNYSNKFGVIPEGQVIQNPLEMSVTSIDSNFLDVYSIPLKRGKEFELNLDSQTVLISETAARLMGYEDPVGHYFRYVHDSRMLRVIGVVADIHFESLYSPVEPVIYRPLSQPNHSRYITIRVDPHQFPDTISFLQTEWNSIVSVPFNYFFVNDKLMEFYKSEKRVGNLIMLFSIVAIFLSCLGLLGLVGLIFQQRSKEIGIHKVLGASKIQLIRLLCREFLWIVASANLIAWPIGYFVLDRWLQNFTNRIDLSCDIFVLSGVFVVLISSFTIGYQVIKSVRANPVEALRQE